MSAAKEIGVSFIVGYLVVSAINFIIAAKLLDPWVSSWYCGMIQNIGLSRVPMLFAGLLIPSIIIAVLNYMAKRPANVLLRGAALGLLVGLSTFLGGHLAAHKWTVFPSLQVFLSALCDSIGLAAGSVVIAYVQR